MDTGRTPFVQILSHFFLRSSFRSFRPKGSGIRSYSQLSRIGDARARQENVLGLEDLGRCNCRFWTFREWFRTWISRSIRKGVHCGFRTLGGLFSFLFLVLGGLFAAGNLARALGVLGWRPGISFGVPNHSVFRSCSAKARPKLPWKFFQYHFWCFIFSGPRPYKALHFGWKVEKWFGRNECSGILTRAKWSGFSARFGRDSCRFLWDSMYIQKELSGKTFWPLAPPKRPA